MARMTSSLDKFNVAIVSHVYATGPSQELESYLTKRVNLLFFLGHPFTIAKYTQSFITKYSKGQVVSRRVLGRLRVQEPFVYLKDFLTTIISLASARTRIQLFVGCDSLNALSGLVLRKLGFVDKVIFYSIDYVPRRFGNPLLNTLYHQTEEICLAHCDSVWNLSEDMILARRRAHILKNQFALQQVVPVGANSHRIAPKPIEAVNRFELVYMGHVREGQGLRLLARSLPRIFETWPKARLTIIGSGELEEYLQSEVERMGLRDKVRFTGYIEDHKAVESMLCDCGIGLAPYEPTTASYTWFADPSKPKQYIACGLPVIITSVPRIANVIRDENAGIVIDYTESSLIAALQTLLDESNVYAKFRKGAIKLAAQYDWNEIFRKALSDFAESMR